MHASIHHYEAGPGAANDRALAWRDLARVLAAERGFVSCAVFEASGGFVAIIFCDDAAGLAAADGVVERWVAAHLPDLARTRPLVASGEVVAQRGL